MHTLLLVALFCLQLKAYRENKAVNKQRKESLESIEKKLIHMVEYLNRRGYR